MTNTEILANTAPEVQTLALQLFMDRWQPFNGIKSILLEEQPAAEVATKQLLPMSLGIELFRLKCNDWVDSISKDDIHGLTLIYDYCQGSYTQLSLHRKLLLENADYFESFSDYVSVGPCLNRYTRRQLWRIEALAASPEAATHLRKYQTLSDLKNERLTDNHPLGDRPGVELLRRAIGIFRNTHANKSTK